MTLRSIVRDVRGNDRTSGELTHLRACLDDVNVVMLIDHNDDGAAISRPITFLEMDASGALWCFSGRPVYPRHCVAKLTFTDAAHATYVSLTGLCEMVPDRWHGDRLKSARSKSALVAHSHSPNRTVLRFVPQTAEYNDALRTRLPTRNPAMLSFLPARRGIHDLPRFNQSAQQVAL